MTWRPNRPIAATVLAVGILMMLSAPMSAAGAEDANQSIGSTATPETTATPTVAPPVQLCTLWEGDPFDHWKVREVDQATADWHLANDPNAKIVTSTNDCPVSGPVQICHDDGTALTLVSVDPHTANWHLAAHPGDSLPTSGACLTTQPTPTPEPTPTKPVVAVQPPPTKPIVAQATSTPAPTSAPTTTPTPAAPPATTPPAPTPPELALTGADKGDIALAGAALILIGTTMLGLSSRRLRTHR